MWIKARKEHESIIINYVTKEFIKNIFVISNIKNYGFDNPNLDIWIDENKNMLNGVTLRYHTNLICYSKCLDTTFEILPEILKTFDISVISGKSSVVKHIKSYYKLNEEIFELPFLKLEKIITNTDIQDVQVANIDNTLEIAKRYGDFPEFKDLYSEDLLKRQKEIASRIESGEGIHIIIKKNNLIIAHGNTTAQNDTAGMIGGIFVDMDYRRQGFGTKILVFLSNYLLNAGKTPCLFYGNTKLEDFFKSIGYIEEENWSILRRKLK